MDRASERDEACFLEALGLVSAGILAGLLAIALRRRQGDTDEGLAFESDSEIVGEYVTAPEPVPAT